MAKPIKSFVICAHNHTILAISMEFSAQLDIEGASDIFESCFVNPEKPRLLKKQLWPKSGQDYCRMSQHCFIWCLWAWKLLIKIWILRRTENQVSSSLFSRLMPDVLPNIRTWKAYFNFDQPAQRLKSYQLVRFWISVCILNVTAARSELLPRCQRKPQKLYQMIL